MSDNDLRNFCYIYGKEKYTGSGQLVDLGSWLGATVVPLCEGLRFNKNFCKDIHSVHCFDAFVWYDNMFNSVSHYPQAVTKYKVGDSFSEAFRNITQPHKEAITVCECDLSTSEWTKMPIEYLLIDALKDWKIARNVTLQFYPYILPNVGIVIHEDFSHHYTSWIHLIQYRLSSFFEPLDLMKGSSAKAFRCVKQITLQDLEVLIPKNYNDFGLQDIEEAFAYSLTLVAGQNKASILAAKAMAYRHRGDLSLAKKQINDIYWLYRIFHPEAAEAVADILQKK